MSSGTTPHDEDRTKIGRRHFLTGSLAGVVGSALVRLPAAAAQIDGQDLPMLLGADNVADGPTGLTNQGPGPTLRVQNLDASPGIQVITKEGPSFQGIGGGIIGTERPLTMTRSIAGVEGLGNSVGVLGTTAVYTATHTFLTAGVWGTTPGSAPITITHPIGVAGTAFGGDQIGVVAHNPLGVALSVVGGISVTCGGTGKIPAGRRSAEIKDESINPGSVVLATMTGDPGNKGATIQHVEAGDGSARLSLTAPVRVDTSFTYVCLELAQP